MSRSTIHIDVPVGQDALRGHDELQVEASFDIPVRNKRQGMAITGIVLFLIGLVVLLIMGGFFLAGYPENWFSTWGGDLDELQALKERVAVLGLVGAALLFNGLAFYTYGRTYRGEEDAEAPAHDTEDY